jgi:hypothetical protein
VEADIGCVEQGLRLRVGSKWEGLQLLKLPLRRAVNSERIHDA